MQVAFCEEKVECRRVILLSYFGERGFVKADCRSTCDVCQANVGQQFEGAHRFNQKNAHIQPCLLPS